MTFAVYPLTLDRWADLENLFGPNGAIAGCWCMWWRIGHDYQKRGVAANKASFKRLVRKGPPPGLLAFDGETPVGWCQITPRSELPYLNRVRTLAPIDDKPVWSVSCFYIGRGHRRQGVMTALVGAAVKFARAQGAPALEAYPRDNDKPGSAGAYTGLRSAFTKAGFKEIIRRGARPIMRHDLRNVRTGR
jgi:GNAT superfamily N-acetyltransferase